MRGGRGGGVRVRITKLQTAMARRKCDWSMNY